MSASVVRLYKSFAPEHYDLALSLNRDSRTFSGSVSIQGKKVSRPNKRLVFHQSGLKVTAARITVTDKRGERDIPVVRINTHKSFQEVRLHTDETLYPGSFSVTLEFTGEITDPMEGIYPCYFEHEGAKKVLLATQFESHDARAVFPCIDEPEAKATFDLTITSPAGETVLGNTPLLSQEEDGEMVISRFHTTPKMSTYLLAFVVGELGYKEAKTSRGVIVRTYATPDNVAFTDFALDVAVRTLDFYEDYFGIPYPLEKLDMVALPDFASGAMENWGLVTYREAALFVDPANTSVGAKQYVAMVVAHELAHQWFGNLVTMRWWTDLWLNEGFASWIEYLAVDHLFPDWNMWTQFIVDEQQSAMRLDSLEHTHPIEVPVRHPDEIRTIFDAISYNKGASIIHMLHDYLGPEDFKNGLHHYLTEHAFSNTDTVDLWAALEQASGKPITAFMHAWTSLPGYPIVTADSKDTILHVSQRRFYLNPTASQETAHWPVPLLGNHGLHEHSFNQTEADFTVSANTDASQPLKLNQGQTGFYRVSYSENLLKPLIASVESSELRPLDRLGLLSDAFENAKAGAAPVTDALKLLTAYQNEDNAIVWDIIAASLGDLKRVMSDDKVREGIKPFLRKLTNVQLKRLGWEQKPGEAYFDTLLRPTILALSSSADEPETVREALDRFKTLKRSEDIDPDLRGIVYGTAAREGGETEFMKLLALHNATALSEERTTLAAAITSFKDPALAKKALAFAKTDDVRKQDLMYWVAYSFMNYWTRDVAWEWFKENWEWMEAAIGGDLSFARTPLYVARAFSDEPFLKEYADFFEPKRSPKLDRAINQGQEMITWQVAWKKRDLAAVLALLPKL